MAITHHMALATRDSAFRHVEGIDERSRIHSHSLFTIKPEQCHTPKRKHNCFQYRPSEFVNEVDPGLTSLKWLHRISKVLSQFREGEKCQSSVKNCSEFDFLHTCP